MSGYDSVNRNSLELSAEGCQRWRRGKVTSGGRQFHAWGPATENAQLPTVEQWTRGWTRQSLQEEPSPRRLGRSAT